MPHLSLMLMGQFQVTLDGQPVTGFESDKVRALLAYLAAEPNRAHPRSTLVALLWPGYSAEHAGANLRRALHQLRQTLGDIARPAPFVLATRQTVQLTAGPQLSVDLAAFQAQLARQAGHVHADLPSCGPCMQLLQQATGLYQGDFLAGLEIADSPQFEEWRRGQQEQLHIQALDSLALLAELYAARRDNAQAQHYARRQLQLEPWREPAHQQLMLALARSGQRAAAIGQFYTCRQILAAELGITPDPATVALYEQIRDDRLPRRDEQSAMPWQRNGRLLGEPPELSGESGHAALADDAHCRIPEPGSLYGRADELAQLSGWLAHDGARVVAVLGMGGIGKTALVAAAAHAARGCYDVVIWHTLANAPPLGYVLGATLQALYPGAGPASRFSLDEQLALVGSAFRQRRCLLVMDGLEYVLDSQRAGACRAGYEPYGQLIELLATSQHRGCLLLVSRERPDWLARSASAAREVRTLQLAGLGSAPTQALLEACGLPCQPEVASALAARLSGSPLALRLAAQTAGELFGGDLFALLGEEAPIFGEMRSVLDRQFDRLSEQEHALVATLALAGTPLPLLSLCARLAGSLTRRELIEALQALQQRALLEQARCNHGQPSSVAFCLPAVVADYAIDRLSDQVCREIRWGELRTLRQHALVPAQMGDAAQHRQAWRILQPIVVRLAASIGRGGLEAQIQHLLCQPLETPGCAVDNLLQIQSQLGDDQWEYTLPAISRHAAQRRELAVPEP